MSKSCFVITPIGDVGTETRRSIDGLLEGVLRPILSEQDYDPIIAAHEISDLGSINNQVIAHILEDDLVIANLTENNPNVMYELAIRHATKKPVIHICEKGTSLPFDIKGERTIFYRNDMQGAVTLKEDLVKIIQPIDPKKEYDDNPIYSAVKRSTIIGSSEGNTDGKGDDKRKLEEYILNKLDKIDSTLLVLSQKRNYPEMEIIDLTESSNNSIRNKNKRYMNYLIDHALQDNPQNYTNYLLEEINDKKGNSGVLR